MNQKYKIYDNSNLAESYSGVTTPLTFSFARYVYQEVYKNFCQMMGVDKGTIKTSSDMFSKMIVYIGSRMYYDLINWYRLVSFLPGYSFNKDFFEKMLGVDKKEEFKKTIPESRIRKWLFYFPKTLWQIIKIFFSFFFMSLLVRRFSSNFDRTYKKYANKDLSQETEKSLKEIFNRLTNRLVVSWKIPIANDFAVMVSTGIVHKLFNKWLPEQDSYKFLYIGSSLPLVSLDPGLVIVKIVQMIKDNKDLAALFNSNLSATDILETLRKKYKEHVISKKIFEYIEKYGDRMPGELKLESRSLKEYPEMLIRIIIGAMKNKFYLCKKIQQINVKDCDINTLKRAILLFFLRWARKSIQLREETRFKRTLIFGFARKIFIELGKKYSKISALKNPDDIFYLNLEEVLGEIPSDLERFNLLIKERKDFLSFWKNIELPKRIETDLSISDLEESYMGKKDDRNIADAKMTGMVVSAGGLNKLSDYALVMREFDPTANFNGKIIITSHTDPGWSLVFPFIKGLVVERGGMLSHAAIVAREFCIPCIVGVDNVTNIICTGDKIELNLDRGEIIKIHE